MKWKYEENDNSVSPFIILPYRKRQSMVFYGDKNLGLNERVWRDLIFGYNDKDIYRSIKKVYSNDMSPDNTIITYKQFPYIYVFHIYPAECVENYSGRRGLRLIVGFRIKYRLLRNRLVQITNTIISFFDVISNCSYDYMDNDSVSIPSRFIKKVNIGAYNEYIIRCLTEAEDRMQNIISDKNDEPVLSSRVYHVYQTIVEASRYKKTVCINGAFV